MVTKWALFALACLFVAVSVLVFRDCRPSSDQGDSGNMSLAVADRLDLGEVARDEVFEASFSIQNRSSRPALLSDFSTSCGCLGLYQRTNGELKPMRETVLSGGEELQAIVRLHPGRVPRFAHQISFRTDVPGQEIVSVVITGSVNLGFYAMPESINWSQLRPGEEAHALMHLVDCRAHSKRIPFIVRSTHPAVAVEECVQASREEFNVALPDDCELYRIKVKVKAPEDGQIQGELRVQTGSAEADVRTPFFATVHPIVYAQPSTVLLPRRGSQEPYTARVHCRADLPCVFSVDKVPSGIQAEMNNSVLRISCQPDSLPPDGTHFLLLSAQNDEGQVFKLMVKVKVFTDGLNQKD
jgi:hypothetical protein